MAASEDGGRRTLTYQATARKHLATALRALGRNVEGLTAIREGRARLQTWLPTTLDEASFLYTEGYLLFELGRGADARACAQQSRERAATYQDVEGIIRAELLLGAIAGTIGEVAEARVIFERLSTQVRTAGHLDDEVHVVGNLAQTCVLLQDLPAALGYFQQALQLQQSLGLVVPRMHFRWGFGRLLLQQGHFEEGLARLRQTQTEFQAAGMLIHPAVVALETLEALLVTGQTADLRGMCQHLAQQFLEAGLEAEALTALAYLTELADQPTVPIPAVQHVRAYFERRLQEPTPSFRPTLMRGLGTESRGESLLIS